LSDRPPRRSFFQAFALYWLPVLLYVGVIFTLSSRPNLKAPLPFENGDKVCHMLEYGGLGILMARALRASGRISGPLGAALVVVAVGAAIAAADENFQRLIPGRDSSVYDWMADVTGLVFAQIFYLLFARD
jgi:VanZ family protein